jgi:hypothetical protein
MTNLNEISNALTGMDVNDLAGNMTESALKKVIVSSPVGKIPFVGREADKAATKVAQFVNNQVKQRSSGNGSGASGFGSMQPPAPPPGTRPGAGGGGGGGSAGPRRVDSVNGGGTYNPVNRLNTNADPYTFTINTGITAPVYAPLFASATNGNATMFMQSFSLALEYDTSQVSQFLQSVVYQYLYNAVQRAVNFSVSTSVLSASNIISWFNALYEALTTYFFYKSLLAYQQDPMNRNDAMTNLRLTISPTDLNYLYELERILIATPIPPNLINFCWWLNNNYLQSELPGSTVIKMMTISSTMTTTTSASTGPFVMSFSPNWTGIISNLTQYQSLSNLLARATDWMVKELPAYTSSPVYDASFLTLWSNAPMSASQSGVAATINIPANSSATASVKYSSYTNTLDGLILGLFNIYNTSTSTWSPNLTAPTYITWQNATSYGNTTRIVWLNESAGTGWFDGITCSFFDMAGAGQTFTTQSFTSYATNVIGSQVPLGSTYVLGVNTNSVLQSSLQVAEWMFSIDAIGYSKDNRVYDSKYSTAVGIPPSVKKRRRR